MRRFLRFVLAACFVLVLGDRPLVAAADEGERSTAELIDVRRVWDRGPHNAFTDLTRFQERWYLAFREAEHHNSRDGAIRVLTSEDGQQWKSAVVLRRKEEVDLRDPNFCVTPAGRLMINTCARMRPSQPGPVVTSLVYLSSDGRQWDGPHEVGDANVWLWSAASHGEFCYSFGYHVVPPRFVSLYRSRDGQSWNKLADRAFTKWYPNESSLVFSGDTCYCLLKCCGGPDPEVSCRGKKVTGHLGTSQPPYVDWTWQDLEVVMSGGPKMIQLPDGRMVAAVKLWEGATRLGLCWVDPEAGEMREFLTLPTEGADWGTDFSYPGLHWHDGQLWVSYYSGHEGKASIYVARVKIK